MTTYFYSYVVRSIHHEALVSCGDGTFSIDINQLGIPNPSKLKLQLRDEVDRSRDYDRLSPLDWSQHLIHLVALNPLN